MKKKGDTLIEVALAIGVFSLVAITVTGVVSASLTNAQSALEITLAREELDAQAEALRFIHESYMSGTQSVITTENPYAKLWQTIVSYAKEPTTTTEKNNILKYNPTTCSEIYNTNGTVKRLKTGLVPFVINTRQLGAPSTPGNIVIASGVNSSKFKAATTSPRITYTTSESLDAQAQFSGTTISSIEGIYIIGVQGRDGTLVSGATVIQPGNRVTYYDFYIRSCWMPLNSDRASTISTVVRLYDPAVIQY